MVERRMPWYDRAVEPGSSRLLVVRQGVPTNGRYLRGACGTCRSPAGARVVLAPWGEYD